jgi:uncharacterized membrane protein YfcA
MVFYAFAMQCMSTLAIVRKETNSWRWPAVQLVVMTVIAYLGALATFQYFSSLIMEHVIIIAAVLWSLYFLVQRFRPRKKTTGCDTKGCGCH